MLLLRLTLLPNLPLRLAPTTTFLLLLSMSLSLPTHLFLPSFASPFLIGKKKQARSVQNVLHPCLSPPFLPLPPPSFILLPLPCCRQTHALPITRKGQEKKRRKRRRKRRRNPTQLSIHHRHHRTCSRRPDQPPPPPSPPWQAWHPHPQQQQQAPLHPHHRQRQRQRGP